MTEVTITIEGSYLYHDWWEVLDLRQPFFTVDDVDMEHIRIPLISCFVSVPARPRSIVLQHDVSYLSCSVDPLRTAIKVVKPEVEVMILHYHVVKLSQLTRTVLTLVDEASSEFKCAHHHLSHRELADKPIL